MAGRRSIHAIAFLQLDEGDEGFGFKDPHGRQAKFAIEQIDGDKYFFPTQEDGERFIDIHGLLPVSDSEFARIRDQICDGGSAAG